MNHIAIDLHDQTSQICVLGEDRKILTQAQLPTTRAALQDFFRNRERARVVFEAGPHSLWVGELLREIGHEPVACHARRVRLIAESRNKNDRVDAELLARMSISDLDLMRPVQQRTRETLDQRSLIRARALLVETKKNVRITLRGLVKPFGVKLPRGRAQAIAALGEAELPPYLRQSVDALLEVFLAAAEKVDELEETIEKLADDEVTTRFMTVPGIGALTALSYRFAIEDPHRFASHEVGAFLGLTPENRSSAGKKLRKSEKHRPGDKYLRSLLVQAAWSLMNGRSDSDLAVWGRKLLERIGPKKAPVAVARKLAVLLHHLWLREENFLPHPNRSR